MKLTTLRRFWVWFLQQKRRDRNANPIGPVDELGPQMIANRGFQAGTTSWAVGANWTLDGGLANANITDGTTCWQPAAAPEVGKIYRLGIYIASRSAGSFSVHAGGVVNPNWDTTGLKQIDITAVDVEGFGFTGYDNAVGDILFVSMREVISYAP